MVRLYMQKSTDVSHVGRHTPPSSDTVIVHTPPSSDAAKTARLSGRNITVTPPGTKQIGPSPQGDQTVPASRSRSKSTPGRQVSVNPRDAKVQKVMLCLESHHIKSKNGLQRDLKSIISELFKSEIQSKRANIDECLSVFNNGLSEYAKSHQSIRADLRSDDLFIKHFRELKALTPTTQTKTTQAEGVAKEGPTTTQSAPVTLPTATSLSPPSKPAIKDVKALAKSYDQLKKAKETISERSEALVGIIKEQPVVTVAKVIIGAGDMGTTLWLEKYKYAHGKTDKRIAHDQLPDTLMIASDTGKWKHNYTLAQSHRVLEREPGTPSPSAFVQSTSNAQDRQVNARHLYQANLMALAETQAPAVMDSFILSVEKQENHTDDWQNKDCAYRLQVVLPNKQIKFVYTNEVEVAAGFGSARNIFPSNYITQELYDKLSVYDSTKRCTPVVDGNAFMLQTEEEDTTLPRTVIIYGGGGNATACYAKACFGKDIRSDIDHAHSDAYTQAHPNREILWVSRDGFESAGVGTLAQQAIHHAQGEHTIYSGGLTRIEYNHKTKKMIAYIKMGKGTYEGKPIIPQKKDLEARPTKTFWEYDEDKKKYMPKKCIGFECDQFVFSVGQDNSKLRKAASELGPLKLHTTKEGVVTGLATGDDRVRFFGAAASSLSDNAAAPYNKETRSWIVKQNLCADAEWPGVMPPSRAQIRLEAFDQPQADLPEHVHALLDDIGLCLKFLKKAGVENEAFLNDLVAIRKTTSSGASHEQIVALIAKHRLQGKIGCIGHCYIRKIPLAGHFSVS